MPALRGKPKQPSIPPEVQDRLTIPAGCHPRGPSEVVDLLHASYVGDRAVIAEHQRVGEVRTRQLVLSKLRRQAKTDVQEATRAWREAYMKGDPEELLDATIERQAALDTVRALEYGPPEILRPSLKVDTRLRDAALAAWSFMMLEADLVPEQFTEHFEHMAHGYRNLLARTEKASAALEEEGSAAGLPNRRRAAEAVIASTDALREQALREIDSHAAIGGAA